MSEGNIPLSFTLMKGQRSSLKIVTMAKLITLSVQLIIPNYLVILSHQHSTTVSSETYSLIHLILYFIYYYYLKNNLTFCNLWSDPWCDLWCDPWCNPWSTTCSNPWSNSWSDAVWSGTILVLSTLLWFPHPCQPSATTISVCTCIL